MYFYQLKLLSKTQFSGLFFTLYISTVHKLFSVTYSTESSDWPWVFNGKIVINAVSFRNCNQM